IIDISRTILTVRPGTLPVSLGDEPHIRIQPIEDLICPYYLRFMVEDRPGVLSQISGILGMHDISIASVIQRGRNQAGAVPLVIMTHAAQEKGMRKALQEIKQLECVREAPVLIRVEGES